MAGLMYRQAGGNCVEMLTYFLSNPIFTSNIHEPDGRFQTVVVAIERNPAGPRPSLLPNQSFAYPSTASHSVPYIRPLFSMFSTVSVSERPPRFGPELLKELVNLIVPVLLLVHQPMTDEFNMAQMYTPRR
jgi:hypothetical protein